jgi:hypothetical protein
MDVGVQDLFNGGYFTYLFIKGNDYYIFNGTILDDNKNYNSTLDLPQHSKASKYFNAVNNFKTAFVIIKDNDESFEILSTNFPEFFKDGKYI